MSFVFSEVYGDFTGFTFNGVHSSELGIVRVSDGDRYTEQLQPEFEDKTAEIPGLDGSYYFGSNYRGRNIQVSIVYDNLTEVQFRKISRLFGTKQIGELIFDETPYKKYLVKIESPIELTYVCFDEPAYTWQKIPIGNNKYQKGVTGKDYEYKQYTGLNQRIYKGEGTISFIAYYSFAKSVFKVLPSSTDYPNVNDWAISSGILSSSQYASIDKCTVSNNIGTIKIYNAGDVDTGFRLYVPISATANRTLTIAYTAVAGQGVAKAMEIVGLTKKGSDIGILIDTNTCLIQGVASSPTVGNYTTSGNIYNECINAGHFFKLIPNATSAESSLTLTGNLVNTNIKIFYDYLYL